MKTIAVPQFWLLPVRWNKYWTCTCSILKGFALSFSLISVSLMRWLTMQKSSPFLPSVGMNCGLVPIAFLHLVNASHWKPIWPTSPMLGFPFLHTPRKPENGLQLNNRASQVLDRYPLMPMDRLPRSHISMISFSWLGTHPISLDLSINLKALLELGSKESDPACLFSTN